MNDDLQNLIKSYDKTKSNDMLDKIVKGLMTQAKLWIAFFPDTNCPYVEIVQNVGAAFVFTKQEYYAEFQKHVKQAGLNVQAFENNVSERAPTFARMHFCGIKNIIVDNGQTFLGLRLKSLVEKPSAENFGPCFIPVKNPAFSLSACLFIEELKRGTEGDQLDSLHYQMLLELHKARFMLPTIKEGKQNDNYDVNENEEQLSVPFLTSSDNKRAVPVFTDWFEYTSFDNEQKYKIVNIDFEGLKSILRSVDLLCINPFGINIPVSEYIIKMAETAAEVLDK